MRGLTAVGGNSERVGLTAAESDSRLNPATGVAVESTVSVKSLLQKSAHPHWGPCLLLSVIFESGSGTVGPAIR